MLILIIKKKKITIFLIRFRKENKFYKLNFTLTMNYMKRIY